MGIGELLLIAVALSMDAFAVGMSDGMAEPAMPFWKHMTIAAAFGAFQFLMPVAGYFASSAFAGLVQKIAPYLSFALLALIGGKSVFSYGIEQRSCVFCKKPRKRRRTIGAASLFAQAVATSMDALAVGITMLAAEESGGLPFPAVLSSLLIGMVTFTLSSAAVRIGEHAGDKFSDRAELLGGFILMLIGTKLLLEGVL